MTRTDPLTPEQLEPVAQALNDKYLRGSQGAAWTELDETERVHWRAETRTVLTAAIDAGLVVRAEERDSARRVVDLAVSYQNGLLEGTGEEVEDALTLLFTEAEAHRSAYPADQGGGDRG